MPIVPLPPKYNNVTKLLPSTKLPTHRILDISRATNEGGFGACTLRTQYRC